MVLESPPWGYEELGGGLRYEAFDYNVRTEAFEKFGAEVYVVFWGEEFVGCGAFFVFAGHGCAAHYLQLV